MQLLMAVAFLASGMSAPVADLTQPITPADLVFEEVEGVAAVEAEHFYKQTFQDKRAWHITSSESASDVKPDADPPHVAGASGGAYVEILPDTRRTDKDKLIAGENFSNEPGLMAVLHYRVHFNTPGRYHVWVRAFSTGAEDNGVHVGLDGTWPESGQRWQTVQKQKWSWDSKQRTQQNHSGEQGKLFLEIDKAGEHEILFSLREDGFEMDKFILTKNRAFAAPLGIGPAPRVKQGQLPKPFPEVPAATALPQIERPESRPSALAMEAGSFPLSNSGYYLDKGKWLAINPAKNQTAKTAAPFPYSGGRYHVTLQAVGESDGKSTYQVLINDSKVGDFTCPLSSEIFEEGPKFHTTWMNVAIQQGDVVAVSSKIATSDGKEHSRARIARLTFEPADESTKRTVAKGVALAKPAAAVGPAPVKPLTPLVQPRQPDGSGTIVISGELKQWHKVTLTLDGPYAHEQDNQPNPFTDCAMIVTFIHESGAPEYAVPGYFAADGNAANTSADSGRKWRAHLSPDKPGKWTYSTSFLKGQHVAVSDAQGTPVKPFDGQTGAFTIAPTDKTGRDFRGKGRLQYVGKHHLQFAGSNEYFLKAGADAPENFLAYRDFDGDFARDGHKDNLVKDWQPHVRDWKAGDPTWQNGKGKGIVGALNYLASAGANAVSFLTMNIIGDDQNVFPYVSYDDYTHLDVSRVEQWEMVFEHAQNLGLFLHFKTQEAENQGLLDGGEVGPQRQLYYRELIARFGHHLAINWNMGEEIGPWQKTPPSPAQLTPQRLAMAEYFYQHDPYHHHVVIHNGMSFDDILGPKAKYTGVSEQCSWSAAHQQVLRWIRKSDEAGKPWAVANDEQNPADMGVPPDPGYQGHSGEGVQNGKAYTCHDVRKSTLWGTLLAGGWGVEYYFGYKLPQSDLDCQDYRSREQSWGYGRIALDCFSDQKIPFWEMKNFDALVGNPKNDNSKYCLAKPGEVYLVFLPDGGTTDLDLTAATGSFTVKWFNPRRGGALQDGSVRSVSGGGRTALGHPPAEAGEDWLVVVRR